jgi:hypothetical protein
MLILCCGGMSAWMAAHLSDHRPERLRGSPIGPGCVFDPRPGDVSRETCARRSFPPSSIPCPTASFERTAHVRTESRSELPPKSRTNGVHRRLIQRNRCHRRRAASSGVTCAAPPRHPADTRLLWAAPMTQRSPTARNRHGHPRPTRRPVVVNMKRTLLRTLCLSRLVHRRGARRAPSALRSGRRGGIARFVCMPLDPKRPTTRGGPSDDTTTSPSRRRQAGGDFR